MVIFTKKISMKKILLFTLLAVTFNLSIVYGQLQRTTGGTVDTMFSYFNTVDSVDVNNIHAAVLVCGDLWHLLDSPNYNQFCNMAGDPWGGLNFDGALWVSGYDAGGDLHLSAQTYRQDGNTYWPGPLDASDTLTYVTSASWNKIWKVNRSDIQYFQSITTHTIGNTPNAILTWPGRGNIYAAGAGGISLYVNTDMAPFVDLNGNGIYEPLLGEYPDVPGDQALWWVFSDNGPAPSQSNGKPLDVEIHAMAYAYGMRNTFIDNVIYYDYKVINKSPNTYTNTRIAFWDAVNLGDPTAVAYDHIGFDSVWRLGISYYVNNCFNCAAGESPNPLAHELPVAGITMVKSVGDTLNSYVPVGSFDYYNNDNSVVGNPTVDSQYNNYMRSKLRNGQHFTNDFTGRGHPSQAYGSGPNTNYVFTGDPSDTSQWSECVCYNNSGYRTFVLSTSDFTMNPGGSYNVVFALITTNIDSIYGCPFVNFDTIKIVADTAWKVYQNPLPPIPASVHQLKNANTLNIYPNPAETVLHIASTGLINTALLKVINVLGQQVPVDVIRQGSTWDIDVSQLSPGMYSLNISNGDDTQNSVFVKQ